MKRPWALLAVGLGAAVLALGVASARAGWQGISDLHYDDSGRVCTNGMEFGLSLFSAPTITAVVHHVEGDVDVGSVTKALIFNPVPEIGPDPFLYSNIYRVLFSPQLPAGDHVVVSFPGTTGSIVTREVQSCTLGAPFTGFFGDVANPPALDTPKKNKPIKLKFSLPGNHGLSIFSEAPTFAPIPCSAPSEPIEYQPTTASGTLAYDAREDRYVYTWNPPAGLTGCQKLFFRTNVDGLQHGALFDFG
jgi:hypothetical protein